MRKFVDIVNDSTQHEFLYHCDTSHVPHFYEITQTKFLSWEPLHQPLSTTIKCARPDDLSEDEYVASYVFKKLYLKLLIYSFSSLMHGTTVSKNFDKESTASRLFEGCMHFLKKLNGTLGGDLFLGLLGFHQAFLYMNN
jgi:hypothetical protein